MIKVQYNIPFEVNHYQLNDLMYRFCGCIAHRQDETTKKFYVKAWLCLDEIQLFLNKSK